MNTRPMKLVTIICESLARKPLRKFVGEAGAHGYTLLTVEGGGKQGHRTAEFQEYANIQVEVTVQPSTAENLLTRFEGEFSQVRDGRL